MTAPWGSTYEPSHVACIIHRLRDAVDMRARALDCSRLPDRRLARSGG